MRQPRMLKRAAKLIPVVVLASTSAVPATAGATNPDPINLAKGGAVALPLTEASCAVGTALFDQEISLIGGTSPGPIAGGPPPSPADPCPSGDAAFAALQAASANVPVAPGSVAVLSPRPRHEVVVAFVDGDPDNPIAIGSIHSAATTPLGVFVLRNPGPVALIPSPSRGVEDVIAFVDGDPDRPIVIGSVPSAGTIPIGVFVLINPGPVAHVPKVFVLVRTGTPGVSVPQARKKTGPRPRITFAVPNSAATGAKVTVKGSGFAGTYQVLFGITSVPFTVNKTGTVITTTTPAGPAGIDDITVNNIVGSAITPFAHT